MKVSLLVFFLFLVCVSFSYAQDYRLSSLEPARPSYRSDSHGNFYTDMSQKPEAWRYLYDRKEFEKYASSGEGTMASYGGSFDGAPGAIAYGGTFYGPERSATR